MTNRELVKETWHWIVEDNLGIEFALGVMIQNNLIKKEEAVEYGKRIEEAYKEYFLERFGVELFSKCPKCQDGLIKLKSSYYGQFMSCDNYPKCKNTYTDRFRRKKK